MYVHMCEKKTKLISARLLFSLFHFPLFWDSLVYHHVVFVEQVCLPTQYLNGCFCFFGHPVSKNNNNQKTRKTLQ